MAQKIKSLKKSFWWRYCVADERIYNTQIFESDYRTEFVRNRNFKDVGSYLLALRSYLRCQLEKESVKDKTPTSRRMLAWFI